MSTPNATNANFDGIHVSKGFVRGLQGQVLKLEQVQQSLIRQLEHANKLASEYYAAAVDWQHKHDTALHEMAHLEQLLAEQIEMSTSRSPSPSPAHRPHRNREDSLPPHEPMSPVSIPDNDDNDSALNEFYGNYYPNDAYSSQTTDCSGDPICHSDSD
jgi:hypothetical protein